MTAEVHHLLTPAQMWESLPTVLGTLPAGDEALVAIDGAATCAVVGALADQWTRPVGVWLVVHDGYSASLAARDVATLSWLVDLSSVVLSSPDGSVVEHARVFAALLSADEASVETAVATLSHAYNRPAPRVAVSVACATVGPHADAASLIPLAPRTGVAPWRAAHESRHVTQLGC